MKCLPVFRLFVWAVCLCMCLKVLSGSLYSEDQNYRIVIPDNPSEVVKSAASELKLFLDKTYDKPIVLNGKTEIVTFYVGVSAEAIMAGFTDLPNMSERFGVFRKGQGILLHGDDDSDIDPFKKRKGKAGTLSAVYYFLQKYAGVNFIFPGDNGFTISKNKELLLAVGQDIPKPSFQLRSFSMRTRQYSANQITRFFRRMLGNIPVWSTYDYYYIFMNKWKKRFWNTKQDYFMLRNGKRVSQKYPLHIPCLSNPEVIKQTAADITEAINKKPSIKTVRMFCDAPIYQCQCERCVNSVERKYAKKDSESGEEIYGFQKKVADIVWQSHPGLYFFTQTKGRSYHQPPKLVKLGKKFVVAQLVPRVNPNSDFDYYVNQAKEWQKTGVKTILKSYPRYNVKAYADYPVMTPFFTVKYFRLFAGIVKGADNSELHFGIPYAFSALGQYVQMKALFDIDTPAETWVKMFCEQAYPGAEKEMLAFYKEMDKLFMVRNSNTSDPLLDAYLPDNLHRPMALLDAAAKKVQKNRSNWFDDLYKHYKKFYKHCQDQRDRIEKIRSQVNRTITIPYLANTPNLDVSPLTWNGAQKYDFNTPKRYEDFQKSEMIICCTDNDLFIGLIAHEKFMSNLKAECKENGKGPVWADDCFEVMLNPDSRESIYYQIIINSLGVHRSLIKGAKKKTATVGELKYQVKAACEKNQWRVAIKIPLNQFSAEKFKNQWRLDVFRSRFLVLEKGDNSQQSGISLLGTSYHNLNEYLKLTWPKQITEKR